MNITRTDWVLLGLAGAGLAAAWAANQKVVAGVIANFSPKDYLSGPAYLVSNQPVPFVAGAPMASGILPPMGNLQGGGAFKPMPDFSFAGGCGGGC